MFNAIIFEREIDRLIIEGRGLEAEEQMLKTYSELRAAGNVPELERVVMLLAHFYSMPDTEDVEKAEARFLEREELSPGAYVKSQTALFYFYVLEDYRKTIRKVDEIVLTKSDLDSYYSAQTLKGQAFINLHMLTDAERVLDERLSLVRANSRGLPYGDEMNLMELGIGTIGLAPKCRELLELVIPRIRDKEYQERGRALLR